MKQKNNKTTLLLKIIGGLLIGFANGFFGGGGGMLAVPFMVYVLKEKEKVAHATAIFIILPLSIVSSMVYIFKGYVKYYALIPTALGVIVGGTLGAIFLNKIKSKYVAIIFSLIMLFAGIKMVI